MRLSVPALAVVLVLSLVIIPSVMAQDAPPSDFITHWDADGDGKVSADEFTGPQENFADLDTNGNGFIEAAEAPQGPPPEGAKPEVEMGTDFIADWDKDGDGKVSRDEYLGPPEHFDALDTNKDGFIDKSEAPQMPPAEGDEVMVEKGQGFINDWDADGDGKVSADEYTGPPENFQDLDTNKDGFIDKSEEPQPPVE
jgi:Ca2+-binding EF-hand superfamily protein